MNEFLRRADETPVTLLVTLAYITLAFLTDPFHPTGAQLMHYGALVPLEVADGQPWRLLTHAFLHGGIIHLAVNTISLLNIGPLLERSIGSVRFAVVYVVTAIAGGIAGVLGHHPLGMLVGGFGALFGMMGALLALVARSGRHSGDFFGNQAARSLMGNIAVNLALGFYFPNISNAAHIGGMIAGFLLVLCFLDPGRRGPTRKLQMWRVTLGALFAAGILATLMPVTRWDWQLLSWERTAPGSRRDDLRAAYAASMAGRRADWLLLLLESTPAGPRQHELYAAYEASRGTRVPSEREMDLLAGALGQVRRLEDR
jgi:membrane associated rhomboid family serine protease